MKRFQETKRVSVKLDVLQLDDAPENLLLLGLQDKNWRVRLYAISHANATEDMRVSAATDKRPNVRMAAMRDTKSIDLLEIGMKDKSVLVRCAVAANSHITMEMLETLLKDKDEHVTVWALRNMNVPVEVLRRFVSHENIDVRLAVSVHPKTPAGVLDLMKGDTPHIVHNVTMHANVSEETLLWMLRSDDVHRDTLFTVESQIVEKPKGITVREALEEKRRELKSRLQDSADWQRLKDALKEMGVLVEPDYGQGVVLTSQTPPNQGGRPNEKNHEST
jgi:hypothetical protein